MAKISNNQPAVPFNASTLKKAVVSRNKKLADSNKNLEAKIKELKAEQKQAEKDLHSKRADCEGVFNELESAGKELVAVQKESKAAKKKLKDRLFSERKIKSSSKKLESSMSKLQNEHSSLTSKIGYLHEQEKEHNLLTQSLEASTESLKAELTVIDKKLSIARAQCGKDINALDDSIVDKNLKLDEVDVMISKAESEYLSWEKKISVAKNNVLEEEDRIETVKKNFKTWKITAVEEVARMKLRGKIETIDKAGLKDVLSR